jgi:hypothetical protein
MEHRGLSAPDVLLRLRLIDEEQFLSAWARFSGLPQRVVTPEDVPASLMKCWGEDLAIRHRAMPCGVSDGNGVEFAFEEPPDEMNLRAIGHDTGIEPAACALLRPTNFLFLRNHAYPRRAGLNPRPEPLMDVWEKLENGRREVREFQCIRNRSLADALVECGAVPPLEARRGVARELHAMPASLARAGIDDVRLGQMGALFCEVHGLVPLAGGGVAIRERLHPEVAALLQSRCGADLPLAADLPSAHFALWRQMLKRKMAEDDLIGQLLRDRAITGDHVRRVREMQKLLSDPADRLLVQLGAVTRERVLYALMVVSGLPLDDTSQPIKSSALLLPPALSRSSHLGVLAAENDLVVIGLCGLPTADELAEITQRFVGVSLVYRLVTSTAIFTAHSAL